MSSGSTTPRPHWLLALLVFIIALLPLWEAAAVALAGTMAKAHCGGLYAQALCSLGVGVGKALFGEARSHMGYVVLSGALGAGLVYLAWRLDRRATT